MRRSNKLGGWGDVTEFNSAPPVEVQGIDNAVRLRGGDNENSTYPYSAVPETVVQ